MFLHLLAPQTFIFRHLRQLGDQGTQISDSQLRLLPIGSQHRHFIGIPEKGIFTNRFQERAVIIKILLRLVCLHIGCQVSVSTENRLLQFFLLLKESRIDIPVLCTDLIQEVQLGWVFLPCGIIQLFRFGPTAVPFQGITSEGRQHIN